MIRSALVLGVAHQLQGSKFLGYIDDSSFRWIVESNIAKSDVVFEEASGRGPSIAENFANKILGTGHYVDVDPSPNERARHGIPDGSSGGSVIDPMRFPEDHYEWVSVGAQKVREELWLRKIMGSSFQKAFVIVGVAHSLSISFRLSSAGVQVEKSWVYTPYHRLCRHLVQR
jgi:hypothetical protein